MARTRWVVSVPLIPYLLGKGLRGLFVLAFVVCALVLAFAWPLVAFHSQVVVPKSCQIGGFGIQDCTPAHKTDGPPTALGWFLELCWLTAICWAVKGRKSWKRARQVIAQTEAEGKQARSQPKAGPGPRDYHLAPPVKP